MVQKSNAPLITSYQTKHVTATCYTVVNNLQADKVTSVAKIKKEKERICNLIFVMFPQVIAKY